MRGRRLVPVALAAALLVGAVAPSAAEPSPAGLLSVAPSLASAASLAALPRNAQKLYVDPDTQVAAAVRAARASGRTSTAKKLEIIARTPQARWVGDWNSVATVRADVRRYARAAAKQHRTPVVVVYAIPGRDCGEYSAGGWDATTYRKWIVQVAKGLKSSKALVVLEPDSLASDCGGARRNTLLKYAVARLTAAGAWVYLDAGNSKWLEPKVIAKRLKAAGVSGARGFATNVSNFRTTAAEKKYGARVSAALARLKVSAAHRNFVIDTSRNGRGPAKDDRWCNPPGRGLGEKPRMVRDASRLDGLLWIKSPGESDGECDGAPRAGEWFEAYALDLVKYRKR